ncbi:prevent-host-death family antitoxin [Lacticaseibacillus kribbianus]|uniref:prevent-host-death family antitoxin n=1 Tax=Lacticaseibacillus kribbianus TaxID=2926292 RepID=UPI001CD1990A|nr:prevent-host-death family antitoxin [Lacticaseibacillus kribbianus]
MGKIKGAADSLEYAIARDQLIRRRVLPEDEPIHDLNAYWKQIESCVHAQP